MITKTLELNKVNITCIVKSLTTCIELTDYKEYYEDILKKISLADKITATYYIDNGN